MYSFGPRDIVGTAYAAAKIIDTLQKCEISESGVCHRTIQSLFGSDSHNRHMFQMMANVAVPLLRKFDARCLSNLTYAFATTGLNPVASGSDKSLFEHVASVSCLAAFNSQDLSNMLWAFMECGQMTPHLLESMTKECMNLLTTINLNCRNERWNTNSIHPVELGMFAISFAKAGCSSGKLFQALAEASTPLLHLFKPQELANIAYGISLSGCIPRFNDGSTFLDHMSKVIRGHLHTSAKFKPKDLCMLALWFAKAGHRDEDLFQYIAQCSISILPDFESQGLSNLAYAFALVDYTPTMPDGKSLLEHIAAHALVKNRLPAFNAQELANLVLAFATAQVPHRPLFNEVAKSAILKQNEFTPQNVSNLLWAFATAAVFNSHLFQSFTPTIEALLKECQVQFLTTIAWAFAVANVNAPSLFNSESAFINILLQRVQEFSTIDLNQLHQYCLWRKEQRSDSTLPSAVQNICYRAFLLRKPRISNFQNEVTSALRSMGLNVQEEVLLQSGYRIDAVVELHNGRNIGVEVDGPSHFMDREPSGRTILKWRQVSNLDQLKVVSVPYWKWAAICDPVTKRAYLSSLLGMIG
mmetsp:Transcript_7126/g.17686  ORF Transcript_7126/g.17686 Transcript_7126/m.17686 type:complete len:584 (+) Transcript_7126:2283-4034(+)